MEAALSVQPERVPSGLGKVPRLPCRAPWPAWSPPARSLLCRESAASAVPCAMARVEAALRDHSERALSGVEKLPRLPCPAPWPA
eukprot:1812486-Pyramimonas_sp.AAC.1